MTVGPQAHKGAVAQVFWMAHFQSREFVQYWQLHKIWVRRRKGIGDVFIFLRQNTASGVHQAPPGFEQARGTVQNGRLCGRHIGNAFGLLAPFEIGVAAQSAQT